MGIKLRHSTGTVIVATLTLITLSACNSGGSSAPSAFPVAAGEIGPIAQNNARQQPFGCQTFETELGQPQVDNMDGIGYPVTNPGGPAPADHVNIDAADIVGYSANCGAPTQVDYYYRSESGGDLQLLEDPSDLPADMATLDINGETVNYIVRHEVGTINRFIYSVAMLTPEPGDVAEPDMSTWNRNLVFHFGGGVGIGYSQSNGFNTRYVDRPDGRDLNTPLLENGYAVVSSTGTGANTTYNLLLMGQTAEMVKRQFVTAYADPDHTFGLGGSGGAIQQYIFEQNIPDLLDALMPLETFGDMITQINPVGDCELLEFYFDQTDSQVNGTGVVNPKWQDWESRQWIEGLNAINGAPTGFDQGDGRPIGSSAQPGTTECIEGWRGLSPLVLNPKFTNGDTYDIIRDTQPEVFAQTRFNYYEDLSDIFGVDAETGFARSTFDNVGVQYGLKALNQGNIDLDEFLLINAYVGGPKPPSEQVPEGFPFGPMDPDAFNNNVDPWSARNGTALETLLAIEETGMDMVAPRAEGDLEAMRAAYREGLVFLGDIDDPMLTLDAYQEPELDMHHSREKFEIRERMLQVDGDISNLVLWTVDGEDDEAAANLVLNGLGLLESWLDEGVKPTDAVDACFAMDGTQIARGADVYNGVLTPDVADDGACVNDFPIFDSARIVAGENLAGYTFKCQLKTVDAALDDGTYDEAITFSDEQELRLKQIFADGVCDYSQPDRARPDNL